MSQNINMDSMENDIYFSGGNPPSQIVHIELLLSKQRHYEHLGQSLEERDAFKNKFFKYLFSIFPILPPKKIPIDETLSSWGVQKVSLSNVTPIKTEEGRFTLYFYSLSDEEAYEEFTDDDVQACQQYVLPCQDFEDIWENLIYDEYDTMKNNLLQYVETTMLFSDCGVNDKVIGWNRVCLFHGPPGCGKTSLVKALAQKLAIRMQYRYNQGQLIEINAHSLFSKYFSESGKLVLKLFTKIREIIEDEDSFVCVLIDEVESLTAARKAALSGNEPSDSIRVVNAVLTQIDNLRKHKNVLILCTSNITEAIDVAFVDRADIKQFIGYPSAPARYQILKSCISELQRCKIIITRTEIPDFDSYRNGSTMNEEDDRFKIWKMLSHIALLTENFSGRSLRKIPFLAHLKFVNVPQVSLAFYLEALKQAIELDLQSKSSINQS